MLALRVLLCLAVICEVVYNGSLRKLLIDVLSTVIDYYLQIRYRITSLRSGVPLPNVPYRFPNGECNATKFLEGRKRRDELAASYAKQGGSGSKSLNRGDQEADSGIYRIWTVMKGEIVLSDPKHVAAVFEDSYHHTKPPAANCGRIMHELRGQSLGLLSGMKHDFLKFGTETPFTRAEVADYNALIQYICNEYLDMLQSGDRKYGTVIELQEETKVSKGIVRPVSDLRWLPCLIIARIVYGPLPTPLLNELLALRKLREPVFTQVMTGGISRCWISRFLPKPTNWLLWKYKTRWATFNNIAHSYAKLAEQPQTHKDVTRTTASTTRVPIIRMYEMKHGFPESDKLFPSNDAILQTLDEIIWSNLDVTIGALAWILVHLAASPSIQYQLRDEILLFKSRSPNNNNKNALDGYFSSPSTFLDACILESARLHPAASFSIPQDAPTDHVLDSYLIPAGTDFIVDAYALNIDNAFWGADSIEYRPERWQELQRNKVNTEYHYWRFGFGYRECMGKYVVDLILKHIIMQILERWRLELEEGDEGKKKQWDGESGVWTHQPDMQLKCIELLHPPHTSSRPV